MKYSFYCLFFVLLMTVYSCTNNQQKNSSAAEDQSSQKEVIDTADTRLAKDLSVFCTTQIEAGKMAVTKASTQKVKEFGKQSVDLYSDLSRRLNSLSERYAIQLPAAATSASTEKLQKLKVIKGSSFDHAYLLQMLKDHNATIREINAAKNIQTISLKAFTTSNQAAIIKQAYALSDLKDKTP